LRAPAGTPLRAALENGYAAALEEALRSEAAVSCFRGHSRPHGPVGGRRRCHALSAPMAAYWAGAKEGVPRL